jgi:four helix bundle protein
MTVRDFKTLTVWQRAHQVTLQVFRVTSAFPKEERFGLVRQLRRASASVPANIAEGCGRLSDRDFKRFLGMAMGSASELEYHLLLAYDLGMLDGRLHDEISSGVVEGKRMLAALIGRLGADATSR